MEHGNFLKGESGFLANHTNDYARGSPLSVKAYHERYDETLITSLRYFHFNFAAQHMLVFHTLVYGVDLLFLSRLKLFSRLRAGLDDPPVRPELPPGLDDSPRRPLPPFLFILIISSRDIFILSAIVELELVANATKNFRRRDVIYALFNRRWRDVESRGKCGVRRSDDNSEVPPLSSSSLFPFKTLLTNT